MVTFQWTVGGVQDGNDEFITIGTTDFQLATDVTTAVQVTFGTTTFDVTYDSTTGLFTFANNAGGEMSVTDINALITGTSYRNDSTSFRRKEIALSI